MKSACVGVLSIIELKNARWNIEIHNASVKRSRIYDHDSTSRVPCV